MNTFCFYSLIFQIVDFTSQNHVKKEALHI